MMRLLGPVLLIGILGAVLGWQLWSQHDGEEVPSVLWQIEAEPGCDLHQGPCRAGLADGQWVELRITPQPIRMLSPLSLDVTLEGVAAEQVVIDFNGVDMNMGYNRPRLTPSEPQQFRGEGILPMCVLDQMTWRAQVVIDTPQGRGVANFYFDTFRRQPQ